MLFQGKKCVLLHMGVTVTVCLSLVQTLYGPIVPPLNFSLYGTDTGNVLHIIGNPGL